MAVSTATVSITVQGTVTAGNDSFSTDAETAITFSIADLLANDTANGAPATLDLVEFEIVSQPANGTLVDNEDGTFTYTPNEGFCGPDPFDYEITNICQEEPEPECYPLASDNGYFSDGGGLSEIPGFAWGETETFDLTDGGGLVRSFAYNASEDRYDQVSDNESADCGANGPQTLTFLGASVCISEWENGCS